MHDDDRVEPRALLYAEDQNRGNNERDQKGRQVEADLDPENVGRIQQFVSALYQFRRLRRL